MAELFPIIMGFIFMAIVSIVAGLFLKVLNKGWWELRWVRMTYYLIPIFGGICILMWALGVQLNIGLMHGIGASGAALTVVVQIAMLLSLPVSGAAQILARKIKRTIIGPKEVDPRRRTLLKAAAGVFPAAAISAGVAGVASSFGTLKMPMVRMKFKGLPDDLAGLKIVQISDLHLGYYVILSDLKKALIQIKTASPDLVLLTGDIADDLTALPYALEMISQLNPPLGIYACLGNHEYYRGIDEVLKIFSDNPIPLLVSNGLTIDVGESKLYIAGSDDPRFLSKFNEDFMNKTVSDSLADAPEGAFRILMSHRPQGFDFSAKLDAEVTLSGHTHGGQIGIGRTSVFENVIPYKYLWGHYIKENGSQLYTTAGMGHWFPFRLGCPPEAPVIVLDKA